MHYNRTSKTSMRITLDDGRVQMAYYNPKRHTVLYDQEFVVPEDVRREVKRKFEQEMEN